MSKLKQLVGPQQLEAMVAMTMVGNICMGAVMAVKKGREVITWKEIVTNVMIFKEGYSYTEVEERLLPYREDLVEGGELIEVPGGYRLTPESFAIGIAHYQMLTEENKNN